MDVDIRKLKIFEAVARHGGFAEAARTLHLSSAGVSLAVKSLEEQIGFKLFDRSTRRVKLSAAGLVFRPYAEKLLADHRTLVMALRSINHQGMGQVRVAASQVLSGTLIPPINSQFQKLWPQIEVVPVDTLFHHLPELLLRGDAEIGIGPESPDHPELEAIPLCSAALMVVCSRVHRFAGLSCVRWAELRSEKVIAVDAASKRTWARDSDYQVLFEKTIGVGHFTTALALTSENAGVMVSPSYAKQLTLAYDVCMVPLVEPRALRKIMAFRSRSFAFAPATKRYLKHLNQALNRYTG